MKFNVKGKEVDVYPLDNPDFNMVDWVLKINGETSLEKTNELNEKMFDFSSMYDSHVYQFHLSRRWALPKMNGTKLVL